MSQNQEMQAILESINSNIDKFAQVCQMVEINAQKNPFAKQNMANSSAFIDSFKNTSVAMDKLINQAQSTDLGDKFTIWFGWFDKELKSVKAKKSELLEKRNVRNYVYKRHEWHYRGYYNIIDNIFVIMNQVLGVANYAVNQALRGVDYKSIDDICAGYYTQTIDRNIADYLWGKKPGALASSLQAILLGDGYKVVVRKVNFQDDMSISDMIEYAERLHEINFGYWEKQNKKEIERVKDQVNAILKDFNDMAKRNPKHVKFVARHIKVATSYIALLIGKMHEFSKTDIGSLQIISKELISILNGLLDYKGE